MAQPDRAAASDSLLVPAKRFPLAGQVYVIDPGHGGIDAGTKHEWPPGQTGKHKTYIYEKQFTLGLTIELTNQISALGGTVVSTVLIPDSLEYLPFGTNQVPAQGAKHFNLKSRPKIVAKQAGLSRRLEVGRAVMNAYPDQDIYWLSPHFDYVRFNPEEKCICGTRIIYSAETQETTTVKVWRPVQVKTWRQHKVVAVRDTIVTRDSVVAIRPPAFVRDLAQSFFNAGWLRDEANRPLIASGQPGMRHLYVLRGKTESRISRWWRKHHPRPTTVKHRDYNHIVDRVLIEYANFKSDDDWLRLQQPDGSLKRLAEITVQGLIRHAQRDTTPK